MGQTILKPSSNLNGQALFLFGFTGNDAQTPHAIAAGATKGSNAVTMADTTGFNVDSSMKIRTQRFTYLGA